MGIGKYYDLRLKALKYYGGGECRCVRCGFSDIRALSIDHINGGGGKHQKIIRKNIYYWLAENKYPPGYQTLCMNCQFIKMHENKEVPHQPLLTFAAIKEQYYKAFPRI